MRTAIRSPSDPGATLKRTDSVLNLYFQPESTPEAKAAVRKEFVVALGGVPAWAMQKAFDAWVKTGQRRPTPGEILLLAERELKPIADELARRKRLEEDRREAEAEPSDEELAQRRAAAAQIMQDLGFAKAPRPSGPPRTDVTEQDREEMRQHLAAKGLA